MQATKLLYSCTELDYNTDLDLFSSTGHFCYCKITKRSKSLLPDTSCLVFRKYIFTSMHVICYISLCSLLAPWLRKWYSLEWGWKDVKQYIQDLAQPKIFLNTFRKVFLWFYRQQFKSAAPLLLWNLFPLDVTCASLLVCMLNPTLEYERCSTLQSVPFWENTSVKSRTHKSHTTKTGLNWRSRFIKTIMQDL